MDDKPTGPTPKPHYLGYRVALAAVVLMIIGILGLLPISILSAGRNVLSPPAKTPVWITPEPGSLQDLQGDWNNLIVLELLSLDETQQLITPPTNASAVILTEGKDLGARRMTGRAAGPLSRP